VTLSAAEHSRMYREAMTALRETHEAEYQRILAAIKVREAAKRIAAGNVQHPLMALAQHLAKVEPVRQTSHAVGRPRSQAWERERSVREWHRIRLSIPEQASALGVGEWTVHRIRRRLGLRWRPERQAS
jgi:hypothetical protein